MQISNGCQLQIILAGVALVQTIWTTPNCFKQTRNQRQYNNRMNANTSSVASFPCKQTGQFSLEKYQTFRQLSVKNGHYHSEDLETGANWKRLYGCQTNHKNLRIMF